LVSLLFRLLMLKFQHEMARDHWIYYLVAPVPLAYA